MKNLHLPKKWYIARIKFIDAKLKSYVDYKRGVHRGYVVYRYYKDGLRHQVSEKSPMFSQIVRIIDEKNNYEMELHRLLEEWTLYFDEPIECAKARFTVKANSDSPLTYQSWEKLVDQECPSEKNANYKVGDKTYRSRGEMQVAQAANDLGLKYKYDCGIRLYSEFVNFLDFAFAFEELNRWVAYEFLGLLDSSDYIRKTVNKINGYIVNGMYPDRDFFLQSSDAKYLENLDAVKRQLIYIVDKLCEIYVIENYQSDLD